MANAGPRLDAAQLLHKPLCNMPHMRIQFYKKMAKAKERILEVACPDCGAMLRIDAATGLVVSHTSAPRKRMFEDLETAAKAMHEQNERKESLFRQSVEAEKNKEDLFEKKFAEALRKAKDAPEGKPLREFDLD
jgi:recombinational DNA repair ATPase RecF